MFAVFKTLPSSATAAAALLVVSGSAAFSQDAAPDVRLAPQTAVYELSLERSNDGTIAAAEGRLAVQLTDTCEGYALSERMVLELFPADGEPTVIDSQFSSYEARDHSLYRYSSKLIVNGSEVDATEGTGLGGDGARQADIRKPEAAELALPPGALFPLEFSTKMIGAALMGDGSFEAPYFDGDSDNPTVLVSAQFLNETTGPNTLQENGRSWLTTLAFYNLETSAEQPIYQSSLRLYENGVADQMLLNYGDFSIRAELGDLELLPSGCD
ncbi:MAG: DUF1849 family protein [Pseudomonadota bacterium]